MRCDQVCSNPDTSASADHALSVRSGSPIRAVMTRGADPSAGENVIVSSSILLAILEAFLVGVHTGGVARLRGAWFTAFFVVTVHDLDGNQSGNRKTGRQEGRIGLAGKSPEAVLEDGDVEAYEESNGKA